ncbi:Manganese/iron superoxide dismutase [Lasiosphaeria miniovina]|uniref:Manganese/iron superoxide dismutase n=1 Tax=Lasiosphaeria miniovina TaxID=1954250 RepID=A0AA40ED36_9PEZI|nr:Manganese/iron superoxide dismutase [Lasiosphaeria miniovina]KAK0733912.1 Manganese/iron superoxide dismutase [Lasiosphaeria miniovina]
MIRPRLRIPRIPQLGQAPVLSTASLSLTFRRSMHRVPKLDYNHLPGLPGLLSPAAMKIAWTEYQTVILEKLNQATSETNWANQDIKSVVMESSREPENAVVFNHASMAHNNHFFFKQLSPEPTEMSELLKTNLEKTFMSIETLRREMIYTADAMFGPGFVWLVKVPLQGMPTAFQVLTTYLAGSPYPNAHWRRQDMDMNTAVGQSEQGLLAGRKFLQNTAFGIGNRASEASKKVMLSPGGINVIPILCLNTWEHVWLPDYGFGGNGSPDKGKLAFYERWWNKIDWQKVEDVADISRLGMKGV